MKYYYFLYKTINLINGKIYIGVHSTKNLNDGYLGSGKYLNIALNKYGKENFKLEILEYFNSKKEMYLKETEIVNEEFVKREDTYNIKLGGYGGFDYIRNHINYKKWQKQGNDSYLNTRFTNKKHSEETKKRIGLANSIHQKNHNSQLGTCWIYNKTLKENKKIKKDELDVWLNKGWIKGRKIKLEA